MSEGIKMAAIPMVEKMAPNSAPDHSLVLNQYAPMVINHEPQIKNCKKLNTIRRSLVFMRGSFGESRRYVLHLKIQENFPEPTKQTPAERAI
jgi:hypothetical protein